MVGALRGGRAELVEESQPQLHAAALEEHRPIKPVREAETEGLVVMVSAAAETPELAHGQIFAWEFVLRGEQAQALIGVEGEAAAITHADLFDGHLRAVDAPQAFADRIAVKYTVEHLLGDADEVQGLQ